MDARLPLVVFSHLRWDFVFQRPQHLLSRMAHTRPVVVIEEPIHDSHAAPHWERMHPPTNVTVLRPHTPHHEPGFHAAQMPTLHKLVAELAATEGWANPLVWLYTPLALPLVGQLEPTVLIFDCMDELSAFDFAPPELLELEAATMQQADLVFTGGPSLYRAKKDRHPRVFCFPSSVETDHFAQAREDGPEPADQAELPHPRLGFYGVVDERFDRELLDYAAQARPEWQFVIIGPVVKIDPASLPRHANIHYLGQRQYNELPAYLRGWDVCLLPFARNRATEFISPTKTLEYMAAEKPIVSTPITDVAQPYSDIVYLGDTAETFVAACEAALNAGAEERARRTTLARAVLAKTSWDATADAMNTLIEQQAATGVASR